MALSARSGSETSCDFGTEFPESGLKVVQVVRLEMLPGVVFLRFLRSYRGGNGDVDDFDGRLCF